MIKITPAIVRGKLSNQQFRIGLGIRCSEKPSIKDIVVHERD